MGHHLIAVLWTLGSILLAVAAQSLPYNPTTILRADNNDIAYAFLPEYSTNIPQFLSFNISSTLSSSISFQVLNPSLDFLNASNAFVPTLNALGEISIYTGSCNTTTSPSTLWRFTPSSTSSNGNGTWSLQTTNPSSQITSATPDFLSQALSFSTLVHGNTSETNLYIFGGMCPLNTSNSSIWQSAAKYTNRMLRLEPVSASASESEITEYTVDLTSSRAPPIAEAGFTITGLTATYSNGSGVETQQRDYVLIGGHTQTAFINMSQVAIFSLPEENWSFVTVDSPSTSGNTELAIKSVATSVDSRSGHTAVLSEDGGSIVVYGGWVGDVGQAADPQLAILSLGTGFGGSGDWKWEIPTTQPSGSGIYGHGATMLPGNVMMVLGGYNISTSSTSKRDTTSGVGAMFYNISSGNWISEYTNPAYVTAGNSAPKGSSKVNGTKLGLGLGLGLGLAAVLAALIVGFCYARHLRKKREERRDQNLRDRNIGAPLDYSPMRETTQRSGRFPWTNWNANARNSQNPQYDSPLDDSTSTIGSYENLNTGVHNLGAVAAVPSPPKQIPRKPLHSTKARGAYQPTPIFDFNGSSASGRASSLGTAGPIHPIYEADEEESIHQSVRPQTGVGIALGDPANAPELVIDTGHRHSDPFKDPPGPGFTSVSGSGLTRGTSQRSVSLSELESPAQSREREIQEWASDWAAADAILARNSQARERHIQHGRLSSSPVRKGKGVMVVPTSTISSHSGEEDSGRTASNLSERSVHTTGTMSRSGSSSQGTRASSLRGLIQGMIPFTAGLGLSTAGASTSYTPVFDGKGGNNKGDHPPGSSGSNSAKSFLTARSSFPALQAEGESLLPRPSDASPEHSPTHAGFDTQGSPSKSKGVPTGGLGKGRTGWLGSLRRAFVTAEVSGNPGMRGGGEEVSSPYKDYVSSRDVSPSRDGLSPRRAVSASAALWRRKQGKSDWDDSEKGPSIVGGWRGGEGKRASGRRESGIESLATGSEWVVGGEEEEGEEDDEWDIERAVENRVVQVMFTVPKERLRVVNHDIQAHPLEPLSTPSSTVGSLKSKAGSGKSQSRPSIAGLFSAPSSSSPDHGEPGFSDRAENGSLRSKNGSNKSKRSLRSVLGVESVLRRNEDVGGEDRGLGGEEGVLVDLRDGDEGHGGDLEGGVSSLAVDVATRLDPAMVDIERMVGGGLGVPREGSPVSRKSRVAEMVDQFEGRSSSSSPVRR